MHKTVVILGAGGQVGRELMAAAWPEPVRLVGAGRAQVDLMDPAAVRAFLMASEPALIVNAAAYTAVDKAETEPEAAFAVNAAAPARLAETCLELAIPLVHLSTDYVFDGAKAGSYLESDPIAPLGVYGASKAAGEEAVRAILPQHLLLRTAWVFSAHGHNFVKTILRLGRERPELRVVADQWGGPTAAADIAGVIAHIGGVILGGGAVTWGTFHYCGQPATTWHGFTQEILGQALPESARPAVHPIATADYPTPARRPANSVLQCDKLSRAYGLAQPDWRVSLKRVLAQLQAEAGRAT